MTRPARLGLALLPLFVILTLVVWIPGGTVAMRTWRGGGTPTRLGSGPALRVPWLQTIERFPGGLVEVSGTVSAPSREGATIGLPYTATIRPSEQALLDMTREGGSRGARGSLREAVETSLREAAAGAGTRDLAAGTSRTALETGATNKLRERFVSPEAAVRLGAPEVPPEVRASFARERLYA